MALLPHRTATPDTLRRRSPQALLTVAIEHWCDACRRTGGEVLPRVFPPKVGAGLARVETCIDDLPFLVDSIGPCIRAERASIDWLVHPVLQLPRDELFSVVRMGCTASASASRVAGSSSAAPVHAA